MLTRALRSFALAILLIASGAALTQMTGIQGMPYIATKKMTTVQRLADGTMINRVTTMFDARDSQGRTMHVDVLDGAQGHINHTVIIDPVARTTTSWFSSQKQATRLHFQDPRAPALPGSGSSVTAAITSSSGSTRTTGVVSTDPNQRPERRVEKLGVKTVAGVYAEGTRTTVIYPAGFMGNDRPITSTSEMWMAPDLKIIVLSTQEDPRSGTQTIELTNLDRSEPDPSVFQVPEGVTIKDQIPGSYPTSTPAASQR